MYPWEFAVYSSTLRLRTVILTLLYVIAIMLSFHEKLIQDYLFKLERHEKRIG